jgi:hypothetical protein
MRSFLLLDADDTGVSEQNVDGEQSLAVDPYWAPNLGRNLGIQDVEGQRVIQVCIWQR